MFIKTFSLVLFVIQIKADNVVSDTNERKGENGEFKMGFDNSERRFFQSFKDEDWHIVHLKESDFTEREECEETFEDKVKRYKESLKNDGSRVRFVSADAIPRDDSVPTRTCKPKQKDKLASKVTKKDNSKEMNIDENNKTNFTKEGNNVNVIRRANEPKKEISEKNKDTATSAKTENGAKKKNARRDDTEYIFSEAEYDEYGDQWDLGECAADVEQIDLELEDIHEYDVECQFILEWRSMD